VGASKGRGRGPWARSDSPLRSLPWSYRAFENDARPRAPARGISLEAAPGRRLVQRLAPRTAVGPARHDPRDGRARCRGRRRGARLLHRGPAVAAGPRQGPARSGDQGLRPHGQPAPLPILGREPRGRDLRPDPADPGRRDRRGRGQELLDEPRRRRARDHARGLRRPHEPRLRIRRRVDDHAAARQAADRRQRALAQAEDPRGDPRDRGHQHLFEAADPRALFQSDLLRQPGVRGEGRRANVFREDRSHHAHARGGRASRGPSAGALGPRPDPGPECGPREGTARIRARPDGRDRRDHAATGRRGGRRTDQGRRAASSRSATSFRRSSVATRQPSLAAATASRPRSI